MEKCKKTVSQNHITMPETIYNEDENWYVKIHRCIACGLVDDEKYEIVSGEIKAKNVWKR